MAGDEIPGDSTPGGTESTIEGISYAVSLSCRQQGNYVFSAGNYIINVYNAGQTILIEQEIKKQTPFDSPDVDTDITDELPTISVIGPDGENVATDEKMEKADIGEFYYFVITETDWLPGLYSAIVKWDDGDYNGLIRKLMFKLI